MLSMKAICEMVMLKDICGKKERIVTTICDCENVSENLRKYRKFVIS